MQHLCIFFPIWKIMMLSWHSFWKSDFMEEKGLPSTGSLNKWVQWPERSSSKAESHMWVQFPKNLGCLHCFLRPWAGIWMGIGAARTRTIVHIGCWCHRMEHEHAALRHSSIESEITRVWHDGCMAKSSPGKHWNSYGYDFQCWLLHFHLAPYLRPGKTV